MHYLHVYYIICIRTTCYTIGRKVATCYVIGRKVGKVHIEIIERWTVLGAPYGALVIGDFTPQLMKMTSTGIRIPHAIAWLILPGSYMKHLPVLHK